MQMGYAAEDWEGRPIIAIINTWSDAQPCHMHFRERVEWVKRGVLQAGGFPMELPALSLSENFVKPTTMLYRNMLAMETEELLRSHPVDGAVLMGGCDKTTPGLVMGAVSMGIPFIYLPAGPMLRGNYAGKALGSGTDGFKYWDERRAGTISKEEWQGIEGGIARSYGHCMTMGTASTMTAIAEGMGLTLPNASSIPAADANHQRMSANCGRRIVEMVWEDLTPDKVITLAAVNNAVTVAMATGCSTNAIIHLIAMARRAGIPLELDDLDRIGRTTPVIANIRPSGTTYLMEDFFYAGGLRALMKQLGDKLDPTAITVTGKPLVEGLEDVKIWNEDVIRPLSNPVYHEGSLAVLKGNLCPDGAVIKPAACDPKFHTHRGPALVANSYEELKTIINDPDYPLTPDTVLVLRNAGPHVSGLWVRMLTVPYHLLFPAIIGFCCIGAYSINNSVFDVFVMAGFSVIGFALSKMRFEPAPLLLGFILGPMLEENLRRAMLISQGDPSIFLRSPLSLSLLIFAVVVLALVLSPSISRKREEAFTE